MTQVFRRFVLLGLLLAVPLLAGCSATPPDPNASGQSALGGRSARRPSSVPATYAATPNGYFDPSCIAHVQQGETAHADGTIRDTRGAVRSATSCNKPRFDLAGHEVPTGKAGAPLIAPQAQPATTYNGWVESYNTTSIGALSYLSATWVVPATPSAGNQGQTIFFFNGLEGVPTVESILQPVIAYENGTWTATSWNCCASGTTFTGNTIDISPGDVIVGTVTGTNCNASTGLCQNWLIETLDQNTGQVSQLQTASWGVALNWTFAGVMEVYGVSACNDYPASGKISFTNQAYTTVAGQSGTSASWNLGLGSVSPDCGYGGRNDGSSVTLGFASGGSASVSSDSSGNFGASCTGVSLSGSVLSAHCYSIAGQLQASSLDLNTCITNSDGIAAFQVNGGYYGSCHACSLQGTVMSCQCTDYFGQSRPTSIDVNDHVSNCNGSLTCGGC
jgi:hypothetical protein